MDSFEFNKVAGAVLGTALFVMALSIVSGILYIPNPPAKPGFVIDVREGGGEAAAGDGGAPAETPIAVRLQTADATAGQASAKVCLGCHTFGKGEPAKAGPNLYGVVGGPAAHMQGFKYSEAMLKRRDDAADAWTFDNLDRFLTGPKGFVPGTAMTFAGLKKPDARANVIAYLRSLSDSPVPLPAVAEAPAKPAEGAAPVKPADGAAPAKPETAPPAKPAGTPSPAPAQ
jgi:cytochrome c